MLGIDADSPDPPAVRALLEAGIEATFDHALESVGAQVAQYSQLWEEVCLSTPLLESIALKDTLESLKDFPAQYDYRYFAHEIPSDIDYPLAHPVSESLQGVQYVTEYLKRLLIENTFMEKFELDLCAQVLRKVDVEYRELLLNLYEPIAINAIGLALADRNIFSLNVKAHIRQMLLGKLEGSSKQQLDTMLKQAASEIGATTRIDDERTALYLTKTALDLCPRIMAGLKRKSLDGIFLGIS